MVGSNDHHQHFVNGSYFERLDMDNDERDAFEQAAHKRYLQLRGTGNVLLDTVEPMTREDLCWRAPNGSYGVDSINAAWWGWVARDVYQRVLEVTV